MPQVAVRPGKPTWFGTLNGKPILGLPGNPAAAFVCACLFLQPLLDGLLGRRAPQHCVAAVLDGVLGESGANESYLRASASVAADGRLMVRPFDNQDTSLVSVFAAANALIRRQAGAPRAAHGATVEALLLDCALDERCMKPRGPSRQLNAAMIGCSPLRQWWTRWCARRHPLILAQQVE